MTSRSEKKLFQPFRLTSKAARKVFGRTGKAGWSYWSTESCAVGPFKTEEEALSDAISYAQYKEQYSQRKEKTKSGRGGSRRENWK
jgi:hypothetical protein